MTKINGGGRHLTVRVKTSKKRTTSSNRWLARQLNDPYVKQAKKDGYRSRAAYKILELDEKFHLFKPGMKVIDLGFAPGGWIQVAVKKVGARSEKRGASATDSSKNGLVIGIDLLEAPPIPGAIILQGDFTSPSLQAQLKALTDGKVDIVMSDMAPNSTGHAATDHLRIMALVEEAFIFACEVLKPQGVFVAKVWQGGTEGEVLAKMKQHFTTVKHAKPKSSRQDSAESYVVAMGFRG